MAGQERYEGERLPVDIKKFSQSLRGSKDIGEQLRLVDELLSERPRDAIRLVAALDTESKEHGVDPALQAMRRAVLGIVTGLDDGGATAVAVELASKPGPSRPGIRSPFARSRGAMEIAGTRPPAEIWPLLAEPDGLRQNDPEFGLLLLHELVVRGESVPSAGTWFSGWAAAASHHLAQLPAELLPIENGLSHCLPTFTTYGQAMIHPDRHPKDPVPLGQLLPGLGSARAVNRDVIAASFHEWGGRLQIDAFAPGSDFAIGNQEPRLESDLGASAITAATAIEFFFSVSASGGAYTFGPGGSYSRLRTWETIASIVNVDWPAPLDRLAVAVEDSLWIQVEPRPPWFYDVAWDIWLINVSADRVVVIAATDTD